MADSPGAGAFAIGIDLGTSAVKACLVDAAGLELAGASADFPTLADLPGQAEQEPAEWLAAVGRALRGIDGLKTTPRGWRARVGAVGLAGQMPTLVRLAAGRGYGRAITWKDARADAWAATAIDAGLRRRLYERTGMPIDGRYLGPMLRHHVPEGDAAIDGVLSAKDYLCLALTGRRVTDPSTAAGYGAYDLALEAFAPDLCELWRMRADWLPPVRPAHAVAGPLTEASAALLGLPPGAPVCVGAADSVAGAFALCGLEAGVVCATMGSSTIILDCVQELRLDPQARYLLTPHVEAGWFGREMDLLATGTGHQWVSELFGWRGDELDAAASGAPPGARGLVLTPYLAGGEQGALWNPDLSGSLLGLGLQHGAADIARAFLEGTYFEMRRCIDVLAETAPVRSVVISGGICGVPSSLQMLADVLGRPIEPALTASPPALGAAYGALAATRGGAPARMAPVASIVRPGPESAAYDALYERYLEASAPGARRATQGIIART